MLGLVDHQGQGSQHTKLPDIHTMSEGPAVTSNTNKYTKFLKFN